MLRIIKACQLVGVRGVEEISRTEEESKALREPPAQQNLTEKSSELEAELEKLLDCVKNVTALAEEAVSDMHVSLQKIESVNKQLLQHVEDKIIEVVREVALREVNRETTISAVKEALRLAVEEGMLDKQKVRLAVMSSAAAEVKSALGEFSNVQVVSSPLLKEGDCVIETDDKVLDGRVCIRLEAALKSLRETVCHLIGKDA